MKIICLAAVLAPLLTAIITGIGHNRLTKKQAHLTAISGCGLSMLLSLIAYKLIIIDGQPGLNEAVYTWLQTGDLNLEIGLLIDPLSITMMAVVTFVSFLVHVYTIGYMHDDPGYNRFYSHISLFTFAMLLLVTANNFLQLFIGWEAVGLVSYLLIGFWHKKPQAVSANLKAFLVNRVGDFGFLIGIAAVLAFFGTLDYAEIFARADELQAADATLAGVSIATVIGIFLFIGAMGKSAQVPLHVWLPDSMEGPTPISALIHAATMVTAGIFMVARMSPLYEMSETALSFMLVIGSITALFMGLIGLVQNDIKRVVAYSTLSQLGYMTAALGASAYAAAIFHLVTHAFFKALLFLGAGSVILAMHHEQDMRKMGGLYRYMPVTWLTMLAGSVSLVGIPISAGFYSKDSIIEAVRYSSIPGAGFAGFTLMISVLITALYTFRLFFLTFHGNTRCPADQLRTMHESPKTITIPLLTLSIPSLIAGFALMRPMLFNDYFGSSLFVLPEHDTLAPLAESADTIWHFAWHALATPPLYLALAGILIAAWLYLWQPQLPAVIAARARPLYRILECKYGFDLFYQKVLVTMARSTGYILWTFIDKITIDRGMVHGSANAVGRIASVLRKIQTGLLYHYAFIMVSGLLLFMAIAIRNTG